MKKINARVKPAENKEAGNISVKLFECEKCSHLESFNSVEFGEDIKCPKCGAKMYEAVEKEQKK